MLRELTAAADLTEGEFGRLRELRQESNATAAGPAASEAGLTELRAKIKAARAEVEELRRAALGTRSAGPAANAAADQFHAGKREA